MEEVKSKNGYMLLLKGLIMILLGILIFINPAEALLSYSVYIGIGAVVSGMFILFKSFSERKEVPGWGGGIIEGLMDLFFGYILLSHPALTAEILPFVVGFWGAFYGITSIVSAFSGEGSMMLRLMSGILIFILANIMMFNPLFAGMSFAVWVGVLMLVIGIYSISRFFILKRNVE